MVKAAKTGTAQGTQESQDLRDIQVLLSCCYNRLIDDPVEAVRQLIHERNVYRDGQRLDDGFIEYEGQRYYYKPNLSMRMVDAVRGRE